MLKRLPQIRLRAIEPEDLDLLYRIENDARLWNVGATNVPYSRYTLHDYIANSSDDIYVDRQVRFVVDNEEGETVGIADLVHFDPQHLRAEAGIVILDAQRHKGYASAALEELCHYSLRVLHLHQLFAVVDKKNDAAMILFEKSGFSHQAVLKDWLFDGRCYHDTILMQKIL